MSPLAINSKWVEEEVNKAIDNRIPILVLRLPDWDGIPLPQDILVKKLEQDVKTIFNELETWVKEAIASRIDFDYKVLNNLTTLAKIKGYQLVARDTRRFLFTKQIHGGKEDYKIFEFEDIPHSLERLYRLHLSYKDFRPKVSKTIFIYNGKPLSIY